MRAKQIAALGFGALLLSSAVFSPFIAIAQTQDIPDSVAVTPAQGLDTGRGAQELYNTFGPVMGTLMSMFSWLMTAAGTLLNASVYHTVVNMGAYVNGLTGVGVAWTGLRDIGNIILIFGFLAIGISVLLGVNWYGGGTKMLPKLLLAAIFLNFSLFISKAVIDIGNVFATQIYIQINGGTGVSTISDTIVNVLGLSTLYNLQGLDGWKLIFVGLLGIILFVIAAFVMFSLALILVSRFVILVLLIIVAPVGFAGLAVPKLEGIAKQWWGTLFEQTITAPVLLLILYVALKVITDPMFMQGLQLDEASRAQAYLGLISAPTPATTFSFANILLSFLIAMGLLLATTVAAKRLSAHGAKWATTVASYPGRYIARTGANYTGRGLQRFSNTRVGQGVTTGIRAITLGQVTGYDIQKGIKNLQGAKFGLGSTVTERKDFSKTRKTELDTIDRKRNTMAQLKDAQTKLASKAFTPEQANSQIAGALKTLSDKEISELDGIKDGVEELVRNLSPQQFKNYMDNKDVPEPDKMKVRTARFKAVNDAVTLASNPTATTVDIDNAKKEIAKLNNKELPYAGESFLTNKFVAENYTADQADNLTKEGVLSSTQRSTIETVRKDKWDLSKKSAPEIASAIKATKWNRDAVGKIPADTLTDKSVLDSLDADALELIDVGRHANLPKEARQKLGAYLESVATDKTDKRSAIFEAYIGADPRVKRDLFIT